MLRVTDGDTIRVRLASSGARERVRYIGIDTPEVGAQEECYGPEASARNRALLQGRAVRLVFDLERRDRYGRLLAYVYSDGRDVGAELLRGGYAEPLTIAPNVRRAARYAVLAAKARMHRRGLWGAC